VLFSMTRKLREAGASALAEATLELPPLVASRDDDDVEIEALIGIVFRQERDLAQKSACSAFLATRLQHSQPDVVEACFDSMLPAHRQTG
jgi:hypothetical protein